MEEYKKGEWKVILGSYKKTIEHPVTKKKRKAEIFTIVTSDNYQLILREWEKLEEYDKTALEINGEYYKKYGVAETNHKDFGYAVSKYLESKKFRPDRDITTFEDVEKLYCDLNKEGKELYKLDIK